MNSHPEPWTDEMWREYHSTFTRQIEGWLDSGMGQCWLRSAEVRHEVVQCLHRFDGERLHLADYVLMPNHAHVLLTPMDITLSEIVKGIKGSSSRRCNQRLGRSGAFWMDETYDHLVRSERQWQHFQAYIRENPKKAGLREGDYTLYSKDEEHDV